MELGAQAGTAGHAGKSGDQESDAGHVGSSAEQAGGAGGEDAAGGGGTTEDTSGAFVAEAVETHDFSATDLAAVSRAEGLLDLFTIEEDGSLALHRYDRGWQPPKYLARPTFSSSIAFTNVAAAFTGERIDVFAVGRDGNLYHFYASPVVDDPTWFGPDLLAGVRNVRASSELGAASMAPTRYDAFALTPGGMLGHTWGSGSDTPAVEGWDDTALFLVPLSPVAWESGLEAVSAWTGRLDVFFLSLSGRSFQHHWYDQTDGSYWGTDSAPHREELALEDAKLMGGGIDALAAAVTNEGIVVFLRVAAATPRLYGMLYHQGTWNTTSGHEAQPSPVALAACPDRVFAALSWSGPSVDVFGADSDHHVWQARLH